MAVQDQAIHGCLSCTIQESTRYWTGLLLLSWLGLFLTFTINANGSEGINILAVSSVSLALLALQKRVYEHWCKDLLESTFILNLGISSVAIFYLKEESDNTKSQLILSSISIGIAFISFIGTLFYHISSLLDSSNIWKEHMIHFIQKSILLRKFLRETAINDNTTYSKECGGYWATCSTNFYWGRYWS